MFKKMLSTALSVLLILSLIAVMPVMADDKITMLVNGDFEDVATGVYNENYDATNNIVGTFTANKYIKVEVLEMEGYDGEVSKVAKLSTMPNWYHNALVPMTADEICDAAEIERIPADKTYSDMIKDEDWKDAYEAERNKWVFNGSKGAARFALGLPSTIDKTNYVLEMSFYKPESYTDEISGKTFSGSLKRVFAGPLRLRNTALDVNREGQSVVGAPVETGTWYKVKYVVKDSNIIVYVNDTLVQYKKYTNTTTPQYIQSYERNEIEDTTFTQGDMTTQEWREFKARYEAGQSTIVDNIKVYSVGAAAEATATYPENNETGVTFATKPSVTYDLPIMNAVGTVDKNESTTLPDAISTENVTLEDITDPDDIKPLDVAGVTLSADGKTLEIEPDAEFEGNKIIRVTVSGLTDECDNAVAATSFQFETMETVELTGTPVFKKENLVFSNGSEITSLQNGYISCNYTLTNGESASAVDVLFFAVLKVDGVVEGFQFKPATVGANGGTATFNGGFNVTDAANSVIEVCVWDGFRNMASLVPMVTFDAE